MIFKVLGQEDRSIFTNVSPDVFDRGIDPGQCREFLDDPRHHMVVAIDEDAVVGFVSAVHYVHPDKPRELWINEVGVAETHRGRGIASTLLRMMLDVARSLGCREAWVLTERSNRAAMRLYSSTGATESREQPVMFEYHL